MNVATAHDLRKIDAMRDNLDLALDALGGDAPSARDVFEARMYIDWVLRQLGGKA